MPSGTDGITRSVPVIRSRPRNRETLSTLTTHASSRPSAEPATPSTSQSEVSSQLSAPVAVSIIASPVNSRPPALLRTTIAEPSALHGPNQNGAATSGGVTRVAGDPSAGTMCTTWRRLSGHSATLSRVPSGDHAPTTVCPVPVNTRSTSPVTMSRTSTSSSPGERSLPV